MPHFRLAQFAYCGQIAICESGERSESDLIFARGESQRVSRGKIESRSADIIKVVYRLITRLIEYKVRDIRFAHIVIDACLSMHHIQYVLLTYTYELTRTLEYTTQLQLHTHTYTHVYIYIKTTRL